MSSCDEYCANHGCNRGPGCPAGGGCHSMPGCKDTQCPGHPGAKVAKVKASRPAGKHKTPARHVPPTVWQRQMRHLAKWLLIVLAVMTLTPVVVSVALAHAKRPSATDCRALIAGWHPEVPAHVRIKCKMTS